MSGFSYRPNINRNVTRKWAEARKVDYGGDDWGDDGEEDEEEDEDEDLYSAQPAPPPPAAPAKPSLPSVLNQDRRIVTDPAPSLQRSHRAGSFDYNDDRRFFSSSNAAPTVDPQTGLPLLDIQTGLPSVTPQAGPPSFTPQAALPPQAAEPRRPLEGYRHDPAPADVKPAGISSSAFPPRKQSLGQAAAPSLPFDPASPPRAAAVSQPDKPLPFIRPADIYKRMEEEREKERRSQESSRPSIDTAGNITHDNTGQVSSPSSRVKPALEAVPERKSEYGFDNLRGASAQQAASKPVSSSQPPGFFNNPPPRAPASSIERIETNVAQAPSLSSASSRYTDRPDPISASEAGSAVPSRHASQYESSNRYSVATHDALPEIGRTSSFGSSMFGRDSAPSSGKPLPARDELPTPLRPGPPPPLPAKDQPSPPTTRQDVERIPSLGYRSMVKQAFNDEHASPTTTNTTIDRSNSGSTADISPIVGRASSTKVPLPTDSLANQPIEEEPRSRRAGAEDNEPLPAPRRLATSRKDSPSPARRPISREVPALPEPQSAILSSPKRADTDKELPPPPLAVVEHSAGVPAASQVSNSPESANAGPGTQHGIKDIASRTDDGDKLSSARPDSNLLIQPATRPAVEERQGSFRPSIPGGWSSSTSIPRSDAPETPELSSLRPQAKTEESTESIPTATAPKDPNWRDKYSGPQAAAFAAAATAGAALAGAFSGPSLTHRGHDSDASSFSEESIPPTGLNRDPTSAAKDFAAQTADNPRPPSSSSTQDFAAKAGDKPAIQRGRTRKRKGSEDTTDIDPSDHHSAAVPALVPSIAEDERNESPSKESERWWSDEEDKPVAKDVIAPAPLRTSRVIEGKDLDVPKSPRRNVARDMDATDASTLEEDIVNRLTPKSSNVEKALAGKPSTGSIDKQSEQTPVVKRSGSQRFTISGRQPADPMPGGTDSTQMRPLSDASQSPRDVPTVLMAGQKPSSTVTSPVSATPGQIPPPLEMRGRGQALPGSVGSSPTSATPGQIPPPLEMRGRGSALPGAGSALPPGAIGRGDGMAVRGRGQPAFESVVAAIDSPHRSPQSATKPFPSSNESHQSGAAVAPSTQGPIPPPSAAAHTQPNPVPAPPPSHGPVPPASAAAHTQANPVPAPDDSATKFGSTPTPLKALDTNSSPQMPRTSKDLERNSARIQSGDYGGDETPVLATAMAGMPMAAAIAKRQMDAASTPSSVAGPDQSSNQPPPVPDTSDVRLASQQGHADRAEVGTPRGSRQGPAVRGALATRGRGTPAGLSSITNEPAATANDSSPTKPVGIVSSPSGAPSPYSGKGPLSQHPPELNNNTQKDDSERSTIPAAAAAAAAVPILAGKALLPSQQQRAMHPDSPVYKPPIQTITNMTAQSQPTADVDGDPMARDLSVRPPATQSANGAASLGHSDTATGGPGDNTTHTDAAIAAVSQAGVSLPQTSHHPTPSVMPIPPTTAALVGAPATTSVKPEPKPTQTQFHQGAPPKPAAATTAVYDPNREFPTDRTPFRNITALETAQQRIQALNANRETYSMSSGHMEGWLAHMNTPEHADIFSGQHPTFSAPLRSTFDPSSPATRDSNGASGYKQMQEDGRRFLAASTKYGGKAGSLGKGLFAKGKEKLRSVSAGKVPTRSTMESQEPLPNAPATAPKLPTPQITPIEESSLSQYFSNEDNGISQPRPSVVAAAGPPMLPIPEDGSRKSEFTPSPDPPASTMSKDRSVLSVPSNVSASDGASNRNPAVGSTTTGRDSIRLSAALTGATAADHDHGRHASVSDVSSVSDVHERGDLATRTISPSPPEQPPHSIAPPILAAAVLTKDEEAAADREDRQEESSLPAYRPIRQSVEPQIPPGAPIVPIARVRDGEHPRPQPSRPFSFAGDEDHLQTGSLGASLSQAGASHYSDRNANESPLPSARRPPEELARIQERQQQHPVSAPPRESEEGFRIPGPYVQEFRAPRSRQSYPAAFDEPRLEDKDRRFDLNPDSAPPIRSSDHYRPPSSTAAPYSAIEGRNAEAERSRRGMFGGFFRTRSKSRSRRSKNVHDDLPVDKDRRYSNTRQNFERSDSYGEARDQVDPNFGKRRGSRNILKSTTFGMDSSTPTDKKKKRFSGIFSSSGGNKLKPARSSTLPLQSTQPDFSQRARNREFQAAQGQQGAQDFRQEPWGANTYIDRHAGEGMSTNDWTQRGMSSQVGPSMFADPRPDLRVDTGGNMQNSNRGVAASAPALDNYYSSQQQQGYGPPYTRANKDISYGQDRHYGQAPTSPVATYHNQATSPSAYSRTATQPALDPTPSSNITPRVAALHSRSRSPKLGRRSSEELQAAYRQLVASGVAGNTLATANGPTDAAHSPAYQTLGTFHTKRVSPLDGVPRSPEEQEKPWMINLPDDHSSSAGRTEGDNVAAYTRQNNLRDAQAQREADRAAARAREVKRVMLERTSSPTTATSSINDTPASASRPTTVAERFMSHKAPDASGSVVAVKTSPDTPRATDATLRDLEESENPHPAGGVVREPDISTAADDMASQTLHGATKDQPNPTIPAAETTSPPVASAMEEGRAPAIIAMNAAAVTAAATAATTTHPAPPATSPTKDLPTVQTPTTKDKLTNQSPTKTTPSKSQAQGKKFVAELAGSKPDGYESEDEPVMSATFMPGQGMDWEPVFDYSD